LQLISWLQCPIQASSVDVSVEARYRRPGNAAPPLLRPAFEKQHVSRRARAAALGCPLQQLQQLGDVGRDTPRLVAIPVARPLDLHWEELLRHLDVTKKWAVFASINVI